jgi:enoyl-CoA hydratase/carnithine racemase
MDVVVAESDTKFSFPEIRYNLPPGLVVSYLGRKVSDKSVRFLVMTGEEVSAERALAMGLISKVVEGGGLDAAQAKLLEHFGTRPEAEVVLKAAIKQFQNNTGDLTAAMEGGVEIVAAWARRPKPVA